MKVVAFWVGIICLGLWCLWFVLNLMKAIDISGEIFELILHGLFVAVCLGLIAFGCNGIKKKVN